MVSRTALAHCCLYGKLIVCSSLGLTVRIFLFSGGFSLTFGSMFLKTLRVYRIFTSNDRPLLHSKVTGSSDAIELGRSRSAPSRSASSPSLPVSVRNRHSLGQLVALVRPAVRSIQLCTRNRLLRCVKSYAHGSFQARGLDMDTVVIDEIYYCDSRFRQKILFLLYVYKASFLVMGGYLAVKTRHVHIPALNDSKFIVWSIYVVVLTSLFTAILMVSMKNLETYLLICLVVILMTSFILCLVFLPKVRAGDHFGIDRCSPSSLGDSTEVSRSNV